MLDEQRYSQGLQRMQLYLWCLSAEIYRVHNGVSFMKVLSFGVSSIGRVHEWVLNVIHRQDPSRKAPFQIRNFQKFHLLSMN